MSDQEAVERAIARRRELVNDAMDTDLPLAEPERLYEASRYLLEAGGKRLRPTILLLSAESLADTDLGAGGGIGGGDGAGPGSDGGAGPGAGAGASSDGEAGPGRDLPPYREFPTAGADSVDLMTAAVSIEIIQSFTLIHDDIMDDDDVRRGVPAVHREYDLSTAILAGDTLYSKAFERMLETGAEPERSVRALSELATTCTQICEGQSLDIAFERYDAVTPDDYLEMVKLKTAVLYAAAASIPAILLGHEAAVDALYGYGLDVGRAFQIQDDLLDLTTASETLGKQRGSDLVENKQTLITVHARDHGVAIGDLVDADAEADLTEPEVEAAIAELERVGSIEYARETARDLVASGKENLEVLPDNDARSLLADIADYLIEREY
jgi:geranylgeranyl diphosphate synthase type I